jgi:hypothetical protein
MRWVTRKGVKFDRSACAWLVLRHIDPDARIEYMDADDMDRAIEEGARYFHNVTFAGPGQPRARTSFEDLLIEYDLADPALSCMRDFIHAGEIGGEIHGGDDALRAIVKGVNALVSSDQEMVDRMLPIYDALYAYCKRKVAGKDRWASLEPGWGQPGQA